MAAFNTKRLHQVIHLVKNFVGCENVPRFTFISATCFDESCLEASMGSGVANFIGRKRELSLLDELLAPVWTGGRIGQPGRSVLIRGKRRVGKSRLVQAFLDQAGIPYVFYTAASGPRSKQLANFADEVAESNIPDAARYKDFAAPQNWNAALTLLAELLPKDRPSVVVLDEMPYLTVSDPSFEGTLQKVFDRAFSRVPVLLILIGSDLAMMEALNTYGRPFYQRGTEMIVPPLNPAEVASMLDLSAADAFDAYLVTGGLPLILEEWPIGYNLSGYLRWAVNRSTSALLVSAERTLAAEFPVETQAKAVLGAIGQGERNFSLIGRSAGDINPGSLKRSLEILVDKRMVTSETPLSTKPSRDTRYRIVDSYLRFWLAFIQPNMLQIERGRGNQVVELINERWSSWRGRAIEPIIRDAVWLLPELPKKTNIIGSYWTRNNDPEIDIIGADKRPIADRITLVGSIKWLENKQFDSRDRNRLIVHRSQLPGADEKTPLLAVSRMPGTVEGVQIVGPDELLAVWQ